MKFNKEKDQIEYTEKIGNKQKNFEDVIVSSIGEFGRWQVIIVIACKVPMFVGAWAMIMMSFAGADTDWWMQEKTMNETGNSEIIRKYFKKCPTNENQTVVYDQQMYTIIREWDLICSKDWIPNALSTCQMVGVLLGAAFGGQLAEWIGRKKACIILSGTVSAVIFIEAFSYNWQMMMACVFLIGFSLGGLLVVQSCFMLEYISVKWRTILGVIPGWGLGVMMFGVLFKLLPNWRHLCIATSIGGIPALLFLFCIPESIRWLFTHGRYEEGKEILKRLARNNGMPEPDLSLLDDAMLYEQEKSKSQPKYTYWSLMKFKSTRRKIPFFAFMWFFATFGYYGLTLGVSKLSGDITINMVLMGVGEITCMVILWIVAKCFGRKYTSMILWSATGLSSLAITFIYYVASKKDFDLYMNILALISRFFLSAAWASIILYTIESFPTVIRTVAYGFASVCGRIGGIAGTQNSYFSKIIVHLPFTINGILAILCALACIFLEDTYSSPMQDFIEEENAKCGVDIEMNDKGSENMVLENSTSKHLPK